MLQGGTHMGSLCPEVQPPYPFIYLFDRKGLFPFCILSIDKWYPLHVCSSELCTPFNCCKCTVFWIWINHKTRTSSWLFHSHKMHLSAILGLFTDWNDRFPYPCTWRLKKLSPWVEPPCIGHYMEYPPPNPMEGNVMYANDKWWWRFSHSLDLHSCLLKTVTLDLSYIKTYEQKFYWQITFPPKEMNMVLVWGMSNMFVLKTYLSRHLIFFWLTANLYIHFCSFQANINIL